MKPERFHAPVVPWAFVAALILLQAACGRNDEIASGADLAKIIIERAKANEAVDLTSLGNKTCFVAESLYAPGYAREWFIGYEIKDNHYVDRSEGVWHMVIANDKEHVARIYSINQTMLRWNVPEETKIRDAVGCKSTVRVIMSGESAEIIVFPVGQGP